MLSERELEVIGVVERLTAQHLSFALGAVIPQDGELDASFTVDASFDGCNPPVAVEVTSLTDHFEGAQARDIRRFTKGIERHLKKLGIPRDWRLGLRPEVKLADPDLMVVTVELLDIMHARGLPRLGPGTWSRDVTAADLPRLSAVLSGRCDRGSLLGLVLLEASAHGTGVSVQTIRESSDSNSLIRPLRRAMADNSGKLLEARTRGYVTMLAVVADRDDAIEHVRGRAPDFAPGIDHLWLLERCPDQRIGRCFYANRADRSWIEVQAAR